MMEVGDAERVTVGAGVGGGVVPPYSYAPASIEAPEVVRDCDESGWTYCEFATRLMPFTLPCATPLSMAGEEAVRR